MKTVKLTSFFIGILIILNACTSGKDPKLNCSNLNIVLKFSDLVGNDITGDNSSIYNKDSIKIFC